MATHQPLEIANASAAHSSWTSRRASRGGPDARYAIPKAGRTTNACKLLVRKANPSSTAHRTSREVLAVSRADQNAQAAATSKKVKKASGLLRRNIAVATGVSAKASDAMIAATSPCQRRTRR